MGHCPPLKRAPLPEAPLLLALLLACTGADSAPPAEGTPGCDDGERFDGEACVPEACGDAPWGAVAGTLFVDAAAAAGGDGSPDAPYTTVGEALAAASESDVVAVAAGTYRESLHVERHGLTLAGRCAELVTIDGTDTEPGAAVLTFGSEADGADAPSGTLRVSGLTLTGGDRGGLYAVDGHVELRDSVLHTSRDFLLSFLHGTGLVENVVLYDAIQSEDTKEGGYFEAPGLVVWDRAEVEARRVEVREAGRFGVLVLGALTLEDSEVLDTRDAESDFGTGILAVGFSNVFSLTAAGPMPAGAYGRLVLHRVRVAGAGARGVHLSDGSLEFEDLTLDDIGGTGPGDGLVASGALHVQSAGGWPTTVAGTGLTITDSDNGVLVKQESTVLLQDVTLTDIGTLSPIGGVQVTEGAHLTLEDAVLERTRGDAALAFESGTLVLRDTVIRDTQLGGGQDGSGGVVAQWAGGLEVVGGAVAELERVRFEGVRGAAVRAHSQGLGLPDLRLRDVEVADVGVAPIARSAFGVLLQDGVLDAEDLWVHGVDGPGLVLYGWAGESAQAWCRRCRVEDVSLAGVAVVGTEGGTALELAELDIDTVGPDDATGLSVGVLVTEHTGTGRLVLRDSAVSGVHHSALFVSGDGSVDVQDSTLQGGSGALAGGTVEVHGNAVYATGGIGTWDGSNGLRLSGTTLVAGAGSSVLLHGASATLDGTAWEGDGSELRQQHCAAVPPVVGAEEAPAHADCPETERLVVPVDPVPVGVPPANPAF